MGEHPAALMRRAAGRLTELADAASPGPWHHMCMGSEGCSVINDGHLRGRKHVSFSGRKDWAADHADARYIASMSPVVGVALAGWLELEAQRAEADIRPDDEESDWCPEGDCDCGSGLYLYCTGCGTIVEPGCCTCWDAAVAVARAILGEAQGNG